MKHCQFLQINSSQELGCLNGINFYSVGQNRGRCRACPLRELGDRQVCEHTEIYLYHIIRDNKSSIRAEIFCNLKDSNQLFSQCLGCPGTLWHEIITPRAATVLTMHHHKEEPYQQGEQSNQIGV